MGYLVKVDLADAVDRVGEVVLDVEGDVAAGEEFKPAVGQDKGDAAGVIGVVRLFYFEACHRGVDITVEAFNYLLSGDTVKADGRNCAGRVVL